MSSGVKGVKGDSETDFVEVHDEPRHRFRYRNEFAYIYDVLVPPGDTTLYHRHTEDTLYVAIGDVHVCDQSLGGEPNEGRVGRGTTMMRPHREKPLIHQVSNRGDRDMRLIGAEVLGSPAVTAEAPLTGPGLELLMEKPRLRAYRLQLEPGEATGAMDCHFSGLLILLSAATLEITQEGAATRVHSLEPAAFIWQEGPARLGYTNRGPERIEAILGEWR